MLTFFYLKKKQLKHRMWVVKMHTGINEYQGMYFMWPYQNIQALMAQQLSA